MTRSKQVLKRPSHVRTVLLPPDIVMSKCCLLHIDVLFLIDSYGVFWNVVLITSFWWHLPVTACWLNAVKVFLANGSGLQELTIREFSFHQLNANLLWPGTFAFAEWLVKHRSWIEGRHCIELGRYISLQCILYCSWVAG